MPSATEWAMRTSKPRVSMARARRSDERPVVVDQDQRAIFRQLVRSECKGLVGHVDASRLATV